MIGYPGFGDPRSTTWLAMVDLIIHARPKAALLENVEGAMTALMHSRLALQAAGFRVASTVIDAASLLPQRRRRLLIRIIREDCITSPAQNQYFLQGYPPTLTEAHHSR